VAEEPQVGDVSEAVAQQRPGEVGLLGPEQGLGQARPPVVQPGGGVPDQGILGGAGRGGGHGGGADQGTGAGDGGANDGAGERGGGAEDERPGRVELAALDQVEGVADAGVTFGGPEVAEDEAKGVGQLVGAGLVRRGKHGASRGGGGII